MIKAILDDETVVYLLQRHFCIIPSIEVSVCMGCRPGASFLLSAFQQAQQQQNKRSGK
jgi:hypothetical protein